MSGSDVIQQNLNSPSHTLGVSIEQTKQQRRITGTALIL